MGNSRSSRTLETPRLSDKRSSGLSTPGLAKKKSRFSFRRSKSKNISLCLDDIYTEPNYDGFVNDFTPKISSHGIQYGLLRIRLDGMDTYIKRVMRHMEFHLKYQIISTDNACCMYKNNINNSNECSTNQWQEIKFDRWYITNNPQTHFCVRLRSCFSPYKIKLKLTMRSRKTLSQRRIDKPLLAKNIWCPWSDILEVEVPSVMKHSEIFSEGDWIKYKYMDNMEYKWTYGTIKEIKHPSIYKIEHYKSQKEVVIMNGTNEWIKCFPAANYVDISGSMDSDIMLLFGDRMGIDTQNIEDIYNQLYECFYEKYACKIFKKPRLNNVVLVSMAKCIAFNVIDFLSTNKEKVYKIRCCINNGERSHYDNTLRLMSTRSYQINKCAILGDFDRMDFWFYCDICLCRQGVYGWMFRCQFNKNNKNYGHDICLTCIHDMIEGHNMLTKMLENALEDTLSSDCIQIISCYAIGDVIRHSRC